MKGLVALSDVQIVDVIKSRLADFPMRGNTRAILDQVADFEYVVDLAAEIVRPYLRTVDADPAKFKTADDDSTAQRLRHHVRYAEELSVPFVRVRTSDLLELLDALLTPKSDLGAAGRESDQQERAQEPERNSAPAGTGHHHADAPVAYKADASTRDSAGAALEKKFGLHLKVCTTCTCLFLANAERCPACRAVGFFRWNIEATLG